MNENYYKYSKTLDGMDDEIRMRMREVMRMNREKGMIH